MPAKSSSSSDSTLDELKSLLAEAETALSSVGDQAGEEVSHLRDRLRHALDDGKVGARRAYALAKKQAARADEIVHAHPYAALGIGVGVGLLIGALLMRRCSSSCSSSR